MKEDFYILSIDDDTDYNHYLKNLLQDFQVEIETTDNTKDFFEKILHKKPNLCLIDMNLGTNYGAGLHLLKLLRQYKTFSMPIWVISAVKKKESIYDALNAGANDYLIKPLEKVIIKEKLKNFIDLSKFSEMDFRLFPLSHQFQYCELSFEGILEKFDEDYLYMKTPCAFSLHSLIQIDHPIVKQWTSKESITVSVMNCEKLPDEMFLLKCAWSEADNVQLKQQIRYWYYQQLQKTFTIKD